MSTAASPRKDGRLRDGLWIKRMVSVYSPSQIIRWLSKIGYPKNPSEADLSIFETSLENLCLLMRLHITTFPFENTPMHYTSHRTMDISPEGVFQRLVVEEQGSYCFGNNRLFFEMIRGLGYRAYSGAGRINEEPPTSHPVFLSFVHMVIFVQPGDSNLTYLVDASGGGSCLTRPILLADGQTVMGASPTESHVLVQTAREDSSLESSPGSSTAKVEWHLIVKQKKVSSGSPSDRAIYSFIEDEFFPRDYHVANIGVYTQTKGFFWGNVVCAKCFWLSDEEMFTLMEEGHESNGTLASIPLSQRYMGRLAMEGNTVRRHVGSHSEVIRTVNTEVERSEALREIFGIDIPRQNLHYIEGRVPALAVGL